MSDYVPTTEQVRERYILPAHRINHEERGEEFDRWLAEEIRKAKAEALREAAEYISLIPYYSKICTTDRINAEAAAESWLRYHADRVENGDNDE